MADATIPEQPTEADFVNDQVRERFFAAVDGKPPTDEQKQAALAVATAARIFAATIDRNVPDGRNKSTALTELEGVQMRATRGIFAPVNAR